MMTMADVTPTIMTTTTTTTTTSKRRRTASITSRRLSTTSVVLLWLVLPLLLCNDSVESFSFSTPLFSSVTHHQQFQQPKQEHSKASPPWLGSLATTTTTTRRRRRETALSMASVDQQQEKEEEESTSTNRRKHLHISQFNLTTALLLVGLAFDSYLEPPETSSRWERGSKGLNIAFCSPAFTRSVYKGLLEITPQRIEGLAPEPEDGQNVAEQLMTGSGIDACLLVAAIEGSWEEDIQLLETKQYNNGVLDLTGCAHVGRSATVWSSVDEQQSKASKRRLGGRALPYYVKPDGFLGISSSGAKAIWPDYDENGDDGDDTTSKGQQQQQQGQGPYSFYLYLQDPANARLVFTVLDDDRIGEGTPVGSTHAKLVDLIPQAKLSPSQVINQLKNEIVEKLQNSNTNIDTLLNETSMIQLGAKSWTGRLKLTSKPLKKNKNQQILAGAAAGAYVGGPVGAAAGAAIASIYEGQVQGSIYAKLRYLPIPQVPVQRKKYRVYGGTEGVDWGSLYEKHLQRTGVPDSHNPLNDLEHCFFIKHDKTGATCALYRSLEKKIIVISFRGTCAPIDLLTDVSLVQEPWVEGYDDEEQNNKEKDKRHDYPKVHAGFRSSLNSISRRLKELLLSAVGPGESIEEYDLYVTGHSLGGALATLFTADIAEYGIDAGRSLPQLEPSEQWWKFITNTLMGQQADDDKASKKAPPRPKSLRLYSFGSPRVGNTAFANLFDSLLAEGWMTEAYRVVNNQDVVARLPRTTYLGPVVDVNYEHCGPTALVTSPPLKPPTEDDDGSSPDDAEDEMLSQLRIWVEGESDDADCPVRDYGKALTNPLKRGLLAELFSDDDIQEEENGEVQTTQPQSWGGKLSNAFGKLSKRMSTISASDVASLVGIDRKFTERELQIIQSLMGGQAISHHMEDEYYKVVGGASGFLAQLGEELVELEETVASQLSAASGASGGAAKSNVDDKDGTGSSEENEK